MTSPKFLISLHFQFGQKTYGLYSQISQVTTEKQTQHLLNLLENPLTSIGVMQLTTTTILSLCSSTTSEEVFLISCIFMPLGKFWAVLPKTSHLKIALIHTLAHPSTLSFRVFPKYESNMAARDQYFVPADRRCNSFCISAKWGNRLEGWFAFNSGLLCQNSHERVEKTLVT